MNQCLRCDQPCIETSLFCEICQTSLLTRSQQKQVADTKVFSFPPTEGVEPEPFPLQPVSAGRPRLIPKRLRIAFITLSILAVLALLVDVVLVSIALTRLDRSSGQKKHGNVPILALATSTVPPGQSTTSVQMHVTTHSSPEALATASATSTAGKGTDEPPPPTITATAGISITTESTRTIMTNESASQPVSEPVLELSSSSLTFSMTQGQADPANQIVTFANTGGKPLNWRMSPASPSASWLSATPMKGSLAAQQAAQIIVNSNATDQPSGTYEASMTVVATDNTGKLLQGGSKNLLVRLIVLQPCSLQIGPTSLSFNASLLQPTPPPKSVSIKMVGNCLRPVSWSATVDSGKWLTISATSGKNESTISVQVNAKGMLLKSTQGSITISATDQSGATIQNSSQTVTVSLFVL